MSSVLSRVSAIVDQMSAKQMSVGDHDPVLDHLEPEQLVQFTEELENEFRLVLDSDDIVEAVTVSDVATVVVRTLGRLYVD